MKKLLLTLVLAALAHLGAQAQVPGQYGTIQFVNLPTTQFTIDGVRPLNTSLGGPPVGTFSLGVFAGLTADTISSQPVGPLGWNSGFGGLFTAPDGNVYPLNGFTEFSTVFLQFRAWDSVFGTDWEAARAGGYYGETGVRAVVLANYQGPGTVVWSAIDTTKFQAINLVPEPSTVVLVAMAGLVFLLRNKFKTLSNK